MLSLIKKLICPEGDCTKRQNILSEPFKRNSIGMWAWLIQRVTGLGLTFYVLSHIILMATIIISGKNTFEQTFQMLLHNPLFIVFELLILAGIVLHVFNGVRLLLIDLGILIKYQKQMFYAVCVISAFSYAMLLTWIFV